MKVRHLIGTDIGGAVHNIRMELILGYELEHCLASLWFEFMGRSNAITIPGENLKTLLKIIRTTLVKNGTIAHYSIGLHGHEQELISTQIERDHITKMDLEVPRAHAELAMYTLGQFKLTKEELKKHIIQMYDDNFEALRQLKKYGVLKEEDHV